jgi:hypothetical protein
MTCLVSYLVQRLRSGLWPVSERVQRGGQSAYGCRSVNNRLEGEHI